MGRIVLTGDGGARRPASRAWMAWVALGCVLAWVIGYAIVKRFMGGQ
jgi:hypothetical protein